MDSNKQAKMSPRLVATYMRPSIHLVIHTCPLHCTWFASQK